MGTNLDFPVDWSTELPFVDLMRTSRPWISGTEETWEGGPPLALDAHGWPTRLEAGQVVRTLMAWDITAHPAGRYVVRWRGRGRFELLAGTLGRLDAAGRIVEAGEGRLVFELDPRRDGPGILLNLLESDPEDPIREIAVIVPGGACRSDAARYCDDASGCGEGDACVPFEDAFTTRPFHPRFLASMRAYAVIRFMNWADANSTHVRMPETTWASRVEPEAARWHGRVPLEIMIELANAAHVEPWLTLPAQADDDYARHAGALVRERLDPDLRVWVEYSNEVWNEMFPQEQYARARGLALGLAEEGPEAALRFYARRTGELHRAFAEGLGDDAASPSRMVRVYASQAASPWRSVQILDFEDAYTRADVLAIAPYFGVSVHPGMYDAWRSMSLDGFFARAEAEDLPVVARMLEDQRRIAHARGLALVAYEGGQHYVAPGDDGITALFGRAARDPRMETLYDRYLALFRAHDGRLMVHMADCTAGGRDGYWGAIEHLGQGPEEAPKLRALLRAAARTRR